MSVYSFFAPKMKVKFDSLWLDREDIHGHQIKNWCDLHKANTVKFMDRQQLRPVSTPSTSRSDTEAKNRAHFTESRLNLECLENPSTRDELI